MPRSAVLAVIAAIASACGAAPPAQPPIRGTAREPPPAERSPCARMVDHVREVAQPERAQLAYSAAQWAAIDRAMVDSCEATRWPEPALRCYLGAHDSAELVACNSHLSAEQAADLSERVAAVVR